MARAPSPAIGGRTLGPNKASPSVAREKLSFAERKAQDGRAASASLIEGDHHLRDIDRPPPGDVTRLARKPQSGPSLAKQQSNLSFFEDAFAIDESSAAKERVHGDAIVMAEVRTNVIVCIPGIPFSRGADAEAMPWNDPLD